MGDRGCIQLVSFCHKKRAEAQFHVIQPPHGCILHIFESDPANRVRVHHHQGLPFEFFKECQDPRLRRGHLHYRAEFFYRPGRQLQIMLVG